MVYLYLKTHNVTGLMYLGQTRNDPYKYKGSGVYWKRHCKKHGYNINTIILFESEDPKEVAKVGLRYSIKNNIIESNDYANMINECGTGGNTLPNGHSKEFREKLSKLHKGKTLSKEHIESMKLKNSSLSSPVKKAVYANGKYYQMINHAAEDLGVSRNTIRNRVLSPNFINYYYA